MSRLVVFISGGGDLGSGVALRLHKAGLCLMIAELPQPLVVRRLVSFAAAVYQGQIVVEGVTARKAEDFFGGMEMLQQGIIPVLVDPHSESLSALRATLSEGIPVVLVDARMMKKPPGIKRQMADLVVGLGPGFIAGENCHAVVETNRGHRLGRVVWKGPTEKDTGIPDKVFDRGAERVLRAPATGIFKAFTQIGDHLEPEQIVATVDDKLVKAPFRGVLRGLLHTGLHVEKGLKIGDVDPRDDARLCTLVSDKSLAVGGGVLEAILSREDLRPHLWG
jgi:xanthine dehydrogenase accessory factor